MARMFFVLAPAVAVGAIAALIHPAIGFVFGACVAGLGVQVTKARPERGEV